VRAPVFAVLAVALLLGACGRKPERDMPVAQTSETAGAWLTTNGSWEVRVDWETGPRAGTVDNIARLTIAPHGDAKFLPQLVRVTPWMTIHGHGSGNVRPVVDFSRENPGTFRVSNIYFVMSGPWDLKIAISGDGFTENVVVPVEVPRE